MKQNTFQKLRLASAGSNALPLAIFTAVCFACFLQFTLVGGDEVFYGSIIGSENLFVFLAGQYQTWSSRTFIEFALCIIAALPAMVWRCLTPLVILLLAHSLCKLLQLETDAIGTGFVCVLLFLYPWWNLSSAGWIATTMNYLYPLAAGLWALTLVFAPSEKKHAPLKLALCALAMLYACNNEQCAVLFFCILLCTCAYRAFILRAQWRLPLVLLGINLFDIAYALLSPGAAARSEGETTSFFLDFQMRSFFSQLEIGLSKGLLGWLLNRDYILVLFCLALSCIIWQKYRNWLYRAIAPCLMAISIVLCFYHRSLSSVSVVATLTNAYYSAGSVGVQNCNALTAYLPLAFIGCFFIAFLMCIYLALGHTWHAALAIGVMIAGLATLVCMGLSPSIGSSALRTSFVYNMCVIFAFALTARENKALLKRCAVLLVPAFLYCMSIQCISLWEI